MGVCPGVQVVAALLRRGENTDRDDVRLGRLLPPLNPGAMVTCEDYGHHQLLGAPMAVDEFLTANRGAFVTLFFSSGTQLLVQR